MRPLLSLILLLPSASTTLAITLSQFQPIISFPPACSNVYNAPITRCTASDFTNGNACSASCINSLESLSDKINTACVGTRADPSTLIGLFFQGRGVATLCPNTAVSTADTGGGNIGSSTMVASSLVAETSPTSSSIAVAASTTASSNSSSSLAASSTTSTSAEQQPTPTTQSTTTAKASKANPDTDNSLLGGFSTTAVNNGAATVLTSQAQRTGSSNPDAFGGGGSPFEVSSLASKQRAESRSLAWTMLGLGVGLLVVLR